MKVLQITDCHVSGPVGSTYRGSDPRESLERVIDAAIAWAPDLVLATGDLSEDASEASYEWLAGRFSRIPAPVLATPGNHDDPDRLRACFPHCSIDEPLVFEDDWRLILLGSARPGLIGGRLDTSQLDALDALLSDSDRPALLALHHQPWPVGSPWIDRYALEEPERLHAVLGRHDAVRLALWGHVHQDVRLERGGVVGLGAPSSATNSLVGCERFTLDPAGPACRWLTLAQDGTFETGVLRPGAD
jgi:Icc protein